MFVAIAPWNFAVCRITGYAIGAQLEAAASLEIAQVAGQKKCQTPTLARRRSKP
jgi:hypothetical protein